MNFINPAAFWALFTILIIVLLYFLKLKREKKVISNLFLFNRMFIDQKANRPFQRLRKNMLLFIQILFLLIVIFALARPTFIKDIFSNQNYIIILDSSASMNATDVGKNRFDEAKRKCEELINNLADSDMAMIITADSKPLIRAAFSQDKKELISALKKLKPVETKTNLYDAFVVAMSVMKQKRIDKIYVISDGANIGLERLDEDSAINSKFFPEVEFISIGKDSDNVGIVDLDINTVGGEMGVLQIFARVVNFSGNTIKTDIELYNSDNLIDIKEITLAPKQSMPIIFDNMKLSQGLVMLKITLDDDLSVDNSVYAYLKKPESIRALLVTNENMFLENVLAVNKTVSFIKVPPHLYNENEDYSKFDVVIFDSFVPAQIPDANILLIDTDAGSLGITRKTLADGSPAGIEIPEIVDYDKSHPIMKYINLESTVIARAGLFSVPRWMQMVVETNDSGLVYAGEKNKRRIALITFDLADSDFILQSTFPIFIYNTMFYLSDHFDKKSNSFYFTGDSIRRQVFNQDMVRVTTPENEMVEVKVFEDELLYDHTQWVGLYTLKGKDNFEDFFITNLLSEKESNIAPAPFIKIGSEKISPASSVTVRKELWKYFVFIAIFFLFIEWWIFHRKVFS